MNIKKTHLNLILKNKLNIKDFDNAIEIAEKTKGLSILLKACIIFKGLGCAHSIFHKKPVGSKIEHSKRNSNLRMVDCFCCIFTLNEQFQFNKDLGFDLELYEEYIEKLQNEKENNSLKKRENRKSKGKSPKKKSNF